MAKVKKKTNKVTTTEGANYNQTTINLLWGTLVLEF